MKMKNKAIALSILVGSIVLFGCTADKYTYLSTDRVVISLPNGLSDSGTGILNDLQYSWNADSKKLSLQCLSDYGYVTSTFNNAFNNRNTDLVAINSDGNEYDAVDINLYPAGTPPVATTDVIPNAYFVDPEEDRATGVDITCVPLSTDSQWAYSN
jgi:hypothetical protein